jgi:hypothetical protein
MRRSIVRGLIVPACVVLIPIVAAPALAGSNLNYKAAIHIASHQSWTCDTNWPVIEDCSGIQTTYQGCSDFDVFPVFFDMVEVQRIEYAINWPADWGDCAYTSCAGDNTIGNIVSPGDGIAHEWTQCFQTQVLIPGYASFAGPVSPGIVVLATHPTTGFLGATDCDGARDLLIGLAASGVCGIPGEDACDCGCAVEVRSWGGIKGLFR